MKYLDEYRDGALARSIVAEIAHQTTQPWVLMEICGGQTHARMRYGIDEMLPAGIELVRGPGCRDQIARLLTERAFQCQRRTRLVQPYLWWLTHEQFEASSRSTRSD